MFGRKRTFKCPIEVVVSLIENKWKWTIFHELLEGTKRFGELRRDISGVSQKVLTQTLRSMEKDRMVKRKIYSQVPPKVEYSMTAVAIDFYEVLHHMATWGRKYCRMMHIPLTCKPPKLLAKSTRFVIDNA
ncbi:MAG: helix-turn-helix transcriptional regulator [Rickettsiales bacterium]|jgi:DNA-binding HxlR family transcriptional regulator|nr:helix-turn-helix transcriptional regulator [Rickettsiales bacterium]